MADSRFAPAAARTLRAAIRDAGGVEVFAIGDVESKTVVHLTVTCRGTPDAVPALLERPRTGQVVIHNHPSGNLQPSQADFHLAGLYGDDGIGVIIVNNAVDEANWVVEPHAEQRRDVEPGEIRAFFEDTLPGILDGFEARPQQVELALETLASLNEDRPLVAEAGTGTGKSLAYIVPAALWAMANDRRVVISTFTKALQSQLLTQDLPILKRAGLETRIAVLQGRNNYICKRRLGLATQESDSSAAEIEAVSQLVDWEQGSEYGYRGDIPFPVDSETWERVESDGDLTLRVRCPHYESCHYYSARRKAAAAHIIVVNHALLMSDLALKRVGAPGVLPKFQRVIIDEAHHLEDAATGALSDTLSVRSIQRATAPLITRRRRRGAIERIAMRHGTTSSPLPEEGRQRLEDLIGPTLSAVDALRREGPECLEALTGPIAGTPRRMREQDANDPAFLHEIEPPLQHLAQLYANAVSHLSQIHDLFADITVPEADAPPIQDLARARRRFVSHQATIARILDEGDPDICRWIAPPPRDNAGPATLHAAPVQIAKTLQSVLWESIPGTVSTSATLTVAGSLRYWSMRVGLADPPMVIIDSPFDYPNQAALLLPKGLTDPDSPNFLPESATRIIELVRLSYGGTFVLCTSYEAVRAYARTLRNALPTQWPILAHGEAGRETLLRTFQESRRAILIGTDTFWEGVSVQGLALRQVIIPRLPFRVPTDPLHEAKVEFEQRNGRDPFRSLILPHAAIRLKQGFGRLIRSQSDRGLVAIFDPRLHSRQYGRRMLHSLPPAQRIVGGWDERIRPFAEAYWAKLAEEVRRGAVPR